MAAAKSDASKQTNFKNVIEMIETEEISKVEKLRLAILFALRYENDNLIFQMKEKMKTQGITEEQL